MEWCADWLAEYEVDVTVDPSGADSGSYRVVRGCSWILNARHARRSACRNRLDPAYRSRPVPGLPPPEFSQRSAGSRTSEWIS